MKKENFTTLIIDDHPVFSKGLYYMLKSNFRDFDFVISHSGEDAITLIRDGKCVDLILLDLTLPGINGESVLQILKQEKHFIPTLVISSSSDVTKFKASMDLGARGFIEKSASEEQIIDAINCICRGEKYIPKAYTLTISANQPPAEMKSDVTFTPRELDVLKELTKGLSNKDISVNLSVSSATLKRHLEKIYKKLDVNNRTTCVNEVRNLGLF